MKNCLQLLTLSTYKQTKEETQSNLIQLYMFNDMDDIMSCMADSSVILTFSSSTVGSVVHWFSCISSQQQTVVSYGERLPTGHDELTSMID